MGARWEGDDRGRGVGDGSQLVEGVIELVAALREPLWVAEDPDAHLRPHVEAWCRADQRLALDGTRIDADGAYVLALGWRGQAGRVAEIRAAVFSLIGSFAESATYVRQRRLRRAADGAVIEMWFEVGTGELGGDTRFAPHGHAVVIDVRVI